MANFLITPKIQFFDNNGDPLSGGLLHVYEAGTTTNKKSYPTIADANADTNANANPVVLDSRGEADVVILGNAKLKLTTSAAVTVWTVDNIAQAASSVLDGNGNELLEYTSVIDAVNHIGIVNAATGDFPRIRAEGESDTGITFDNKDGEEILIIDSVATSVNHFTISSAASGNNPILEATGDTADIGIDFQAKGTGVYNFKGTTTAQGEIRLFEDTDNGVHYTGFKSPAALTASTTFTMPDGDGNSLEYLSTNASGTLAWTAPLAQAVQADVEAETNEDSYIPPDLVKYNPGVAKVWLRFKTTTTTVITSSYNVTSLTDEGTGDTTITIATDFSSDTGYTFAAMGNNSHAQLVVVNDTIAEPLAGALRVKSQSATPADADADITAVVMYGDQ